MWDDDCVVWDSLAIVEFLADRVGSEQFWPADTKARGMARSMAAEMHSGFSNLRRDLPMNVRKSFPMPNISQDVRGEIDRINRDITALGAVNLAALEELSTARERKSFLDAQSADLNEAMVTLEDAIRKIDGETRDLLGGTFKTVNEHFGRMFPELFGGGNAAALIAEAMVGR